MHWFPPKNAALLTAAAFGVLLAAFAPAGLPQAWAARGVRNGGLVMSAVGKVEEADETKLQVDELACNDNLWHDANDDIVALSFGINTGDSVFEIIIAEDAFAASVQSSLSGKIGKPWSEGLMLFLSTSDVA